MDRFNSSVPRYTGAKNQGRGLYQAARNTGKIDQKSYGYRGSTRQQPGRKGKTLNKKLKSDIDARRQAGSTFTATVLFYLSVLLVIITLPFSLFFITKVVPQYLRVIIFRTGRYINKMKGPGIIFYIPCTDELLYADLRSDVIETEGQAVLTKDSVSVYINVVVFYHPSPTGDFLTMIQDYESAVGFIAQAGVREIFGQKYLHEILDKRFELINSLRETLDERTKDWGLTIERVEIKDISLPEEMVRSLAAEAEAKRRANAKIIEAEGESKAAEKLKLASLYLQQSEAALQIRYLQTMATVAQSPDTKICFPFPLDFGPLMPK